MRKYIDKFIFLLFIVVVTLITANLLFFISSIKEEDNPTEEVTYEFYSESIKIDNLNRISINQLSPNNKGVIDIDDSVKAHCGNNQYCVHNAVLNIDQYVLTAKSLNVPLDIWIERYPFRNWGIDNTTFWRQFSTAIMKEGVMPVNVVDRKFGVNSEGVQAEISEAMIPIITVDIFRTARPATEYSKGNVTFDEHGWPTAGEDGVGIFNLLQGADQKDIPRGHYTVFYEGDGSLTYKGYGRLVDRRDNYDLIDIDFSRPGDRLELNITNGTIKNIRVIMPGGICRHNQFIHLPNGERCPAGGYDQFSKIIGEERNAIIFNPSYMRFLKDFRVLRTMNLMTASPAARTCWNTEEKRLDMTCLDSKMEWSHRSRVSDAVWGGSHLTSTTERFGKGMPLEVQIGLVNRLGIDPWFTIPHNATIEYIENFSKLVKEQLRPSLTPYVEYSNEAWNDQFLVTHYVRTLGAGSYSAKSNGLKSTEKMNGYLTVSQDTHGIYLPKSDRPYLYLRKGHMKGLQEAYQTGIFEQSKLGRIGDIVLKLNTTDNGLNFPVAVLGHNTLPTEEFITYIKDQEILFSGEGVTIDLTGWDPGKLAFVIKPAPNLYRDGLTFYAKKTRQTHDIFQEHMSGRKIIKVVAGYQRSYDMSKSLLSDPLLEGKVDALAIGGYFFGCWDVTSNKECVNQSYLKNARTVDDVFDILTNANNPYGISSLISQINEQQKIADKFGVKLITYEGGQHLTVNWVDRSMTRDEKMKQSQLFIKANSDPRMGRLYNKTLDAWNQITDNSLFVFHSVPHHCQRFGCFGIMEDLSTPRSKAVKYDAILFNQEKNR